MDDGVAVGGSMVLAEMVALMRCESNIRPGALLQQAEIPKEGLIIATRVKRRHVGIFSENLGRKFRCMSGRRVLGGV